MDYPLFWLPFLPKVFAGSGAVFDAGATFFFSLFDVVITSFSVVFRYCGFATTPVLLVQGYTLCAGVGILNDFFMGVFEIRGKGNAKRAGGIAAGWLDGSSKSSTGICPGFSP